VIADRAASSSSLDVWQLCACIVKGTQHSPDSRDARTKPRRLHGTNFTIDSAFTFRGLGSPAQVYAEL
jgi:hypothetical protein